MYLGLWLAHDLLCCKATAPMFSRNWTARPVSERLADQVRAWLVDTRRGGEARKLRQRFMFRMGVCERMRDRVPQIVHYLLARPSNQIE